MVLTKVPPSHQSSATFFANNPEFCIIEICGHFFYLSHPKQVFTATEAGLLCDRCVCHSYHEVHHQLVLCCRNWTFLGQSIGVDNELYSSKLRTAEHFPAKNEYLALKDATNEVLETSSAEERTRANLFDKKHFRFSFFYGASTSLIRCSHQNDSLATRYAAVHRNLAHRSVMGEKSDFLRNLQGACSSAHKGLQHLQHPSSYRNL